jgi:uncharacterized protein (DUF608 family)
MRIETMTKILLYLSVIIVALVVGFNLNKPSYQIPDYYKDEFKQSQEVINELQEESKLNRNKIESIRHEMDIKDSIIYNANESELDSLLNEFWNATK